MKRKSFGTAALVTALWLGLTLAMWFGPRQEISLTERRKLEQMPQLTWESVVSGRFMTGFERFTQDQFPLREGFRQLKARFTYGVLRQKDNHGIYLAGNQAVKLEYPLKETSAAGAVQKFTNIYEQYLKGNCGNIVFSVVPDKSFYLAEQAGAPTLDYEKLFSMMRQIPWADYADITGCLAGDDYYGTDSHWRQERLIPAAEVICSALGARPPREEDYRTVVCKKDFTGVYHGQAAAPLEPDVLIRLESDLLDSCSVYNYETEQRESVYNPDKLEGRDPYEMFLSGSVGLLEIENPAGEPGKELIVFRDSYGSSIAPLLLQGYEKVTLVDIRYLPAAYLGQMIRFDGQDVLFLYSSTVLNSSSVLK